MRRNRYPAVFDIVPRNNIESTNKDVYTRRNILRPVIKRNEKFAASYRDHLRWVSFI